MKRILALAICGIFAIALTACEDTSTPQFQPEQSKVPTQQIEEQTPTKETAPDGADTQSSDTEIAENKELSESIRNYMSESFGGMDGAYPEMKTSWYDDIIDIVGYNLPNDKHSAMIFAKSDTTNAETIGNALLINYTDTVLNSVTVIAEDGSAILFDRSNPNA